MGPLDINDLVRITAVADHGGFTRAARALGMTQPALTRSIAAAERTVGGPLFLRRRPRAEPTALCRMILAEAPEIIARMQDLHRRVVHVRGGSGEELAVASGPFPLESLVLPAVAALRRAHPRVRVRLETLPWPEALAQLRAQRFDLAILTAGAVLGAKDLVVEPLQPLPLVFAHRRDHPLSRLARPSLARILSYPLVTTAQLLPTLHRALAEARGEASARPRADIPFPAVTVESTSAWLGLASISDSIALTTVAPVQRYVASGELTVLAVDRPWLTARHAIVHATGRPLSPAARDFLAEMRTASAGTGQARSGAHARLSP
ncbi:MAG: LysR family transcriptional regulator [Proteobacteria bacterium]|nr:LysR family transcriptional regulator [Pseudomonadota bacterium]